MSTQDNNYTRHDIEMFCLWPDEVGMEPTVEAMVETECQGMRGADARERERKIISAWNRFSETN